MQWFYQASTALSTADSVESLLPWHNRGRFLCENLPSILEGA